MNLPPSRSNDRSQKVREQLDREFDCDHESRAVTVKRQKNGVRYFLQCRGCGEAWALKGAELSKEERENAIPFSKEIKDRWWKSRSERAGELYEKERKCEDEDFNRWYQDYLTTPEWHAKRSKVLKRAEYTCEGCMEEPATEVHHLTYAHVGREMLFELVALCKSCHRQIHNPDSTENDEEEWNPAWDED